MPDFRVHDSAPSHRKMRAAGLAALGLWAMGGAQAMTGMTDGWVPGWFVRSWGPNGTRLARRLCEVGLWINEPRDGEDGYTFHDWADYQRLAADIESARQKARDRMAALRGGGRDGASVRANARRTYDERAASTSTNVPATSPEPAPNVHDSLTLTHGGGPVGGKRPVGQRAQPRDEPPPGRPAERCERHSDTDGDPGPCGACGHARRAAEDWDRRAARRRTEEIRACRLCDGDGYRLEPGRFVPVTPYVRCDHARPARDDT